MIPLLCLWLRSPGSCLREESRSPLVTWGEGGTPCLAHTPLLLLGLHGIFRMLTQRLARPEGTGRAKNTFPGRRFPAPARPQAARKELQGAGGSSPPGQGWYWGCPAGRLWEGFVPTPACPCCQDRCWPLDAPPACTPRHPQCSQPLRQWLRISTAQACPLILLPAPQLPWRAPRSIFVTPWPA